MGREGSAAPAGQQALGESASCPCELMRMAEGQTSDAQVLVPGPVFPGHFTSLDPLLQVGGELLTHSPVSFCLF